MFSKKKFKKTIPKSVDISQKNRKSDTPVPDKLRIKKNRLGKTNIVGITRKRVSH